MKVFIVGFALFIIVFTLPGHGQGVDIQDVGTISGSLQTDIQTYSQDTIIGAPEVPERILSNSFLNLLFTRGKFTAGIRFESYQGPLLGIDPRYGNTGNRTGLGIPYRFARYSDDVFEVTAGNFYEQFGSGMILRTYEERNLGFDNSIDGLRLRFMPVDGVKISGFIGRQRSFWELSNGMMRGGDLSIDLKEMCDSLLPELMQLSLGASVVSRFQSDDQDLLKIPQNVLAWSTRANFMYSNFSLELEYAYKVNDPSATNALSYNTGNALYLNASYSGSGYGVNFVAKRIDNMDFRSDRTATGFAQQVNYLPSLTKQHTWRLITLYPYATQPTGEFGMQGDVTVTLPKGSGLGNDETLISLNASVIHAMDTIRTSPYTYDVAFWWADRIYYRDVNVEISRKFGKDFRMTLAYINVQYDQDVIERRASPNESIYGVVTANFACVELWFKTAKNQSIRTEFQFMSAASQPGAKRALQNGDWVLALAEYSISPHWYFTVFDEYNYGNYDEQLQVHYPNASVAYNAGALRVQGGYGRVRGGILCVGGICRPVPASNGATLNVTYTF